MPSVFVVVAVTQNLVQKVFVVFMEATSGKTVMITQEELIIVLTDKTVEDAVKAEEQEAEDTAVAAPMEAVAEEVMDEVEPRTKINHNTRRVLPEGNTTTKIVARADMPRMNLTRAESLLKMQGGLRKTINVIVVRQTECGSGSTKTRMVEGDADTTGSQALN